MKLSEAIRLGAMLKPQCFSSYTNGAGTCAIGAANEAIGLCADTETWPWLWLPSIATCPVCGEAASDCDDEYECSAVGYIASDHLNDTHRWTRERIANWVETIEAQQAPETIDAAPVSVTA